MSSKQEMKYIVNEEVNIAASLAIQIAMKKNYKTFELYEISNSEYGFYIDFYVEDKISSNDLNKITKEISKVISGGYKIESFDKNANEVKEILKLKKDWDEKIFFKINNNIFPSFAPIEKNINFLKNTNEIKKVVLTKIGGIEYKKNKNQLQLVRINASAFLSDESYQSFEKLMNELKSRDHRTIGEEMKIFLFDEFAGKGFPIWLPNGYYLKEKISTYLKKEFTQNNFSLVSTPILGSKKMYETSGHWELYKENNFSPILIDNEEFLLRPMACPHHILVFKSSPRSYKDLPYKMAEEAKLHRYESSGGLIGLERVRAMELFDSHVFCTIDNIESIIMELNKMVLKTMDYFNIQIDRVDLSLKSDEKDKYFDNKEIWETSQTMLRNILKKFDYKNSKVKKNIEEQENINNYTNLNFLNRWLKSHEHKDKIEKLEVKGEAAFYGPKIDYQYKTNLGKWITISTIQLDFLLPKKFECEYKDKDGSMKTPVLIHFGLIGTYERFISVLLSETKGFLPFKLLPTQIIIMPVNNNFHLEYAIEVQKLLENNGFSVKLDDSNERLSKKVRTAQKSKIPLQIIIGDKEVESWNKESFSKLKSEKIIGNISFRGYGEEETNSTSLYEFIKILINFIKD
ncbi:MAG: aminoacyl--tRNA ligase-related protein [Mycoplasmoidaceae bacterium]